MTDFRSDSVLGTQITIVDRSGDITITSPATQDLEDALQIVGSIAKEGNGGIEIEVTGPDGRIFGPQWIQTKANIKNNAGDFTQKVDVSSGGDYTVDFSDTNGFVGEEKFTVVAPTTQPTAAATTPAAAARTTRTAATTLPTPWPTATQSPLPPITAMCSLAFAGMLIVLVRGRGR